jgi:hypothetical protein
MRITLLKLMTRKVKHQGRTLLIAVVLELAGSISLFLGLLIITEGRSSGKIKDNFTVVNFIAVNHLSLVYLFR